MNFRRIPKFLDGSDSPSAQPTRGVPPNCCLIPCLARSLKALLASILLKIFEETSMSVRWGLLRSPDLGKSLTIAVCHSS